MESELIKRVLGITADPTKKKVAQKEQKLSKPLLYSYIRDYEWPAPYGDKYKTVAEEKQPPKWCATIGWISWQILPKSI